MFLWVHLVAESLKRGIENGDTFQVSLNLSRHFVMPLFAHLSNVQAQGSKLHCKPGHLRSKVLLYNIPVLTRSVQELLDRLGRMPTKLRQLIEQIFESIEPQYLPKLDCVVQTRAAVFEQGDYNRVRVPLIFLEHLGQDSYASFAREEPRRAFSLDTFRTIHSSQLRRLSAWSKGLMISNPAADYIYLSRHALGDEASDDEGDATNESICSRGPTSSDESSDDEGEDLPFEPIRGRGHTSSNDCSNDEADAADNHSDDEFAAIVAEHDTILAPFDFSHRAIFEFFAEVKVKERMRAVRDNSFSPSKFVLQSTYALLRSLDVEHISEAALYSILAWCMTNFARGFVGLVSVGLVLVGTK